MGDSEEFFSAYRKLRKEARARNREASPHMMRAAGLDFTSHNGGSHVVVAKGPHGPIDFWPGTGLWIVRSNKRRERGVLKLIAYVKGEMK
jgi:hypothetical protein